MPFAALTRGVLVVNRFRRNISLTIRGMLIAHSSSC